MAEPERNQRQTQSKAVMEEFKPWLLAEHGRHPPPEMASPIEDRPGDVGNACLIRASWVTE